MGIASGLSLYCYQIAPASPSGTSGVVMEYGSQVENLAFTKVAPGGYGQCTFLLKLADARQNHPELALFSRVAIMAKLAPVWQGEISNVEADLVNEDSNGERLSITALGIGNGLRDDPLNLSYGSQTLTQIVADQLSRRSTYNLPISQDTSAIVPQNPATTYSPAYANNTAEEIIHAVTTYDGDDFWGVLSHPQAAQPGGTAYQDTAGFPLGQVQVHARDKATTHYVASVLLNEVYHHQIVQSADRAYNVVTIGYNDLSSGPGEATATDPRLVSGAQGTAPWRRRKYVRDLSSISTVTAAVAQSIANMYLAQFMNASNKVQLKLRAARDNVTGRLLDPWDIQIDRNILIPELTVRGQNLTATATPGTNQFYIVQVSYAEDAAGNQTVTLDCDNYSDDASILIAQLQLQADEQARSQRTTGLVQAVGASEKGFCGVQGIAAAGGAVWGRAESFKATMVNVPTSITLTPTNTLNNSGAAVTIINQWGFAFTVTATAAGSFFGYYTYQTNGNCLLAVDGVGKTFDHHCDCCGMVTTQMPLSTLVSGMVGTFATLKHVCLACGAEEHFNTALAPADAADATSWRGQQATLIRAAQTALQLAVLTHPPLP